MNDITVTISGLPKTGKTNLAALLLKTFREVGIMATVQQTDDDLGEKLERANYELAARVQSFVLIVEETAAR